MSAARALKMFGLDDRGVLAKRALPALEEAEAVGLKNAARISEAQYNMAHEQLLSRALAGEAPLQAVADILRTLGASHFQDREALEKLANDLATRGETGQARADPDNYTQSSIGGTRVFAERDITAGGLSAVRAARKYGITDLGTLRALHRLEKSGGPRMDSVDRQRWSRALGRVLLETPEAVAKRYDIKNVDDLEQLRHVKRRGRPMQSDLDVAAIQALSGEDRSFEPMYQTWELRKLDVMSARMVMNLRHMRDLVLDGTPIQRAASMAGVDSATQMRYARSINDIGVPDNSYAGG
jgi:hypothetical protein